jgi:hypothetical protein
VVDGIRPAEPPSECVIAPEVESEADATFDGSAAVPAAPVGAELAELPVAEADADGGGVASNLVAGGSLLDADADAEGGGVERDLAAGGSRLPLSKPADADGTAAVDTAGLSTGPLPGSRAAVLIGRGALLKSDPSAAGALPGVNGLSVGFRIDLTSTV